jgi:eukaryotic-like serine/threonine-protein kinase
MVNHRAIEAVSWTAGGSAESSRAGLVFARPNCVRIGDVLDDSFEIRRLLGQGGMGQVFEAYDRKLHRLVAVKVAWPHVVASVRGEALAMAALHHPSVITIFGLGKQDGFEYVVMERIHGVTLEDHAERRRIERSRFSIDEVIELLLGIADGLGAVHGAGMAHCDVKPANVMLAGSRVVLTDFGIFRPESRHDPEEGQGDVVMGSPPYMAPETITNTIALGEAYLVDVYALGVVAFELLTGMLPFWDPRPIRVLQMHVSLPVPDPTLLRSDVPPRLACLVRAMLAKDPTSRPQQMEEVSWQLRGLPAAAPRGHCPSPYNSRR